MRFPASIRPLLRDWLISFLCFGLLAFVLVGEFARFISLPLTEALWIGMRDWFPWAFCTPLLVRLCRRFPLQRTRWKTALPIQGAALAATMAGSFVWSTAIVKFHPTADLAKFSAFRNQGPGASSSQTTGPETNGPSRAAFKSSHFFGLSLLMRLPMYVTILSIAHAMHFYRRSEEETRRALELTASLAQSRLDALKMQLQPHFLFNTLNSIAELVHRDAEAADAMLAALSDLLRLTLETANNQELPLCRELEFVERYLAVEKVRFQDRLQFALELGPETREALVPAFLLQPLVENAVRHGLEPRVSAGLLTIQASREAEKLLLQVADDGVGLRKGQELRERIGLSNTRARLHALYGETASLEICNGNGFSVRIALPFRTET